MTPPREFSALAKVARFLGIVLLFGVGWLYLVSGLVAPMWAVSVLLLIWVAILVAALRIWRTSPWLVLAAPLIAFVIWVATLWAGGELLGWAP